MNMLQDIITYIRRIIKSPSNAQISDDLIIDYINRFWIMDVDARMQLFDLKKKYQFMTQPGVDKYNMPLYTVQTQPGGQQIKSYPVYQGFLGPAYINGVQVPFQTQKGSFYSVWPNVTQSPVILGVGDGSAGPYTFSLPILPNNSNPVNPPVNAILRGHIDTTGIIASGSNSDPLIGSTFNTGIPVTSVDSAFYLTSIDSTGANVIVQDSGQFLTGAVNYGLLMQPGLAPFGNQPLGDGVFSNVYNTTLNTINYLTGEVNVRFNSLIPAGNNIMCSFIFFNTGLPRAILYYDNTLTLRSPPDQIYKVELDAYLSPAAFLVTTDAIPFGYMAEYIARGAARKMLSDTGDVEQFQFYEPLFREQELLVWKRSQRQWTATRTETIYSQGINQGQSGFNSLGGSTI